MHAKYCSILKKYFSKWTHNFFGSNNEAQSSTVGSLWNSSHHMFFTIWTGLLYDAANLCCKWQLRLVKINGRLYLATTKLPQGQWAYAGYENVAQYNEVCNSAAREFYCRIGDLILEGAPTGKVSKTVQQYHSEWWTSTKLYGRQWPHDIRLPIQPPWQAMALLSASWCTALQGAQKTKILAYLCSYAH